MSELFEPFDQTFLKLRLVELVEIVGAKLNVGRAIAKAMIGNDQDGTRHGQAPKLSTEVIVVGSGHGVSGVKPEISAKRPAPRVRSGSVWPNAKDNSRSGGK